MPSLKVCLNPFLFCLRQAVITVLVVLADDTDEKENQEPNPEDLG